MSAPEFSAGDLVDLLADDLHRDSVLRDLAVPAGFTHHLGEAAREVRRLRCRAEPDSSLAHLADRLADHLETLRLLVAATAADYVREGFDVDEAIEVVDRHARELASRMGGKP